MSPRKPSDPRVAPARSSSDEPTFGVPDAARPDYLPGQYIVRLHPAAIRESLTQDLLPGAIEPIEHLRRNAGLTSMEPLMRGRGVRSERAVPSDPTARDRRALLDSVADIEHDLAGITIAHLDPASAAETVDRARSSRAIDFIERVPARWLSAARGERPDPRENPQWNLRAIRWYHAPEVDAGEQTVGIIDSGIDAAHPDLDDVDLTYDHAGSGAADILGHGTHVAGIVAARTNARRGTTGVAGCRVHLWKTFTDAPADDGGYYVDPSMFADALRAAETAGITSLNLSLGGPASSRVEELLIRRLIDAGVVVVAAMGNEYEAGNPTFYPAAYDGVLAVGALTETGERAAYSNTGDHIGLSAPGSNVLSTLPRDASPERAERHYGVWSGTSMATPHVSAAAALVAAARPGVAGIGVRERLLATARTRPRGGSAAAYGAGSLDLAAALS